MRFIRAERQDFGWDWDQGMQVEGARAALTEARDGQVVTACDGLAQLPREDSRAGDAEAALLGCRQQVEVVLLHPVEVEVPGNDAGAGGRPPPLSDVSRCPADNQLMVQPVRRRQPHRRSYLAYGGTGSTI